MQIFGIILLMLASCFWQTSNAIKCYKCRSYIDRDCADNLYMKASAVVDCDTENSPDSEKRYLPVTQCHTIEARDDLGSMVLRGCHWQAFDQRPNSCVLSGGRQIVSCSICDKERCNTSLGSARSPTTRENPTRENPCWPNPCGPNAQCRVVGDTPECSCLPHFKGQVPNCRPECTFDSECPRTWACINQSCKEQCHGSCITGPDSARVPPTQEHQENACWPNPCGPYSQCRVIGNAADCSCLPEYVGQAPHCRPQCTHSSECPTNLACINLRCQDPCRGTCGFKAVCNVHNHSPICVCESGFTGDPFTVCYPMKNLSALLC